MQNSLRLKPLDEWFLKAAISVEWQMMTTFMSFHQGDFSIGRVTSPGISPSLFPSSKLSFLSIANLHTCGKLAKLWIFYSSCGWKVVNFQKLSQIIPLFGKLLIGAHFAHPSIRHRKIWFSTSHFKYHLFSYPCRNIEKYLQWFNYVLNCTICKYSNVIRGRSKKYYLWFIWCSSWFSPFSFFHLAGGENVELNEKHRILNGKLCELIHKNFLRIS